MKFCPSADCPHYSKATKYDRQCYYEPQCWRGFVDAAIFTLGLYFRRRRGDTGTHRGSGTSDEGKLRGENR